jgi:hypothetical protein
MLEAIGKRLTSLQGEKYLGSFAAHLYEVPGIISAQYVIKVQSTDLQDIPEHASHVALSELAQDVMRRYGKKPPAFRDDPTPQSDTLVGS